MPAKVCADCHLNILVEVTCEKCFQKGQLVFGPCFHKICQICFSVSCKCPLCFACGICSASEKVEKLLCGCFLCQKCVLAVQKQCNKCGKDIFLHISSRNCEGAYHHCESGHEVCAECFGDTNKCPCCRFCYLCGRSGAGYEGHFCDNCSETQRNSDVNGLAYLRKESSQSENSANSSYECQVNDSKLVGETENNSCTSEKQKKETLIFKMSLDLSENFSNPTLVSNLISPKSKCGCLIF